MSTDHPLSPRMKKALAMLGTEWSATPIGVYNSTLMSLLQRGLIEERFVQEHRSTRWQYRLRPIAKVVT